MREPQTKSIGGRLFEITPLPAMRALRLTPLVVKTIAGMTPDEVERYARELLSMARVDGHELLKTIDLDMAGNMVELLELLAFAAEVNFGPLPVGDTGANQADPSSRASTT